MSDFNINRVEGEGGGARNTMRKKGLYGDVTRTQMMAGNDKWNVNCECGSCDENGMRGQCR